MTISFRTTKKVAFSLIGFGAAIIGAKMGGMLAATIVGTLMTPYFFLLMQSMRERWNDRGAKTGEKTTA